LKALSLPNPRFFPQFPVFITGGAPRIFGFNVSVARVWADLKYQLQKAGKPRPVEDSYIAAIARRHNLAVGKVKDLQRPSISFQPV